MQKSRLVNGQLTPVNVSQKKIHINIYININIIVQEKTTRFRTKVDTWLKLEPTLEVFFLCSTAYSDE